MAELRAVDWYNGRHWLHGAEQTWPETNCYLDLWIELLRALGRDPLPLLGLAAALDWEADHFTFLKPSASDIFASTGVTLHELALWDDVTAQISTQIAANSVPLLEVDAFFLPDTHSNAYRHKHTKTTIAIAAIDPERRRFEYFHNAGRFFLEGDDYDGALGRGEHRPVLYPFAELARVVAEPLAQPEARSLARTWLYRFVCSVAPGNPVSRFAAALPALLDQIGPDPERINALCFNTTRQLGAGFSLLASHLDWLGEDSEAATRLSDDAKSLQFRIARAARRGRADTSIYDTIDDMAGLWTKCIIAIAPDVAADRLSVK